MTLMKVFVKDGKWQYILQSTDATSTITLDGIVTDTTGLPPVDWNTNPPNPNPTPIIETIDDVDTNVKYTSPGTAWVKIHNQPWSQVFHNKTCAYSDQKDALIEYRFTGKKFEWWTEKRVNHGIASLIIDGQPEVLIDLYANTQVNNSQKVYEKDLPQGTYTVRIKVTGTKNSAATETTIIHDCFKITK
jgi:hypothetical protein